MNAATLNLSPDSDPVVEAIYNPQDLNRYSYVGNNPLSLTDPTGMCFLGCFYEQPWFTQLLAIAIAVTGQYELGPFEAAQLGIEQTTAIVTINAGIVGGVSGYVSTGKWQGALIGAGEGIAFAGVHVIKDEVGIDTSTLQGAGESAFMHGMVGGEFEQLAGGKFGSGFLAAGIGDLAADGDSNELNATDAVKHALAGGLGSLIGGGKFMNGAQTGVFGYLFNRCLSNGCWTTSAERALLQGGNVLGYYKSACGNGDATACFDYHIAANDNFAGFLANSRLIDALLTANNGDYGMNDIDKMMAQIRLDLAWDYANSLPSYEDQARWPSEQAVIDYHQQEFSEFDLPPTTFGGTPVFESWPIGAKTWPDWCPNCTK